MSPRPNKHVNPKFHWKFRTPNPHLPIVLDKVLKKINFFVVVCLFISFAHSLIFSLIFFFCSVNYVATGTGFNKLLPSPKTFPTSFFVEDMEFTWIWITLKHKFLCRGNCKYFESKENFQIRKHTRCLQFQRKLFFKKHGIILIFWNF